MRAERTVLTSSTGMPDGHAVRRATRTASPDRDHAYPAEQRGRLLEAPDAAQDGDQSLLGGVRPVLKGDGAADPPDLGREDLHQFAERHRVAALRGAYQRRIGVPGPRHGE